MISLLLAAAPLALSPAADAAAPPALVAQDGGSHDDTTQVETHGILPWFQGTWEELLAKAKTENKPIFVDFWTTWCGWCKKLDKDTYSQQSVADAMKGFLVYSVDAESDAGKPLAAKYNVQGYPTLLFLEPDGTVREMMATYMPPDAFIKTVERVERNEGTLGALRKAVEDKPDDLMGRYRLALRLDEVGDHDGATAQRDAIAQKDPDGTSLASRHLRFDAALQKLQNDLEPAPIYALMEGETDEELLFQGWYVLWQVERIHLQNATDDASKNDHRTKWFAAGHKIWEHVAEADVAGLGGQLAWTLYENQDQLPDAEKAFALEVAQKAAMAAPDDASTIDTLACCLYMNGKHDEAIAAIKKAIALDPDNTEWKSRLEGFQKGA